MLQYWDIYFIDWEWFYFIYLNATEKWKETTKELKIIKWHIEKYKFETHISLNHFTKHYKIFLFFLMQNFMTGKRAIGIFSVLEGGKKKLSQN